MGGGRETEGAGKSSRRKRRCVQKHSIEIPLTEGAEGRKKIDRNGGTLKGIITSAFAASVILLLLEHTICLTENYLLHIVTREYNDKERAVHCSVWMQTASLVAITHYPKHQKKKERRKKKEEVKRNLAEKSESFAGQHQIRVVCTFSKKQKQKKIMSQRCPANLQGEAM